jgi:hypothetical protein
MRNPMLAGALGLALLAPAGAALASAAFTQRADVAFTTHHPGASTGIRAVIVSTDAGAPGSKPKAARRLVVSFPAGTRFNLGSSVPRACRLSDAQIKTPFGPMCPDTSQVGLGTALLNTMPTGVALPKLKPPLVATVRARVHAYVHSGAQLIVVLYLNTFDLPGQPPVILHAHAAGSQLVIDVPKLVYGRSRKLHFAGISGTIVSLRLNIAQTGSGAHALVRAGACAGGRFLVRSQFSYEDRSQLSVASRTRCSVT